MAAPSFLDTNVLVYTFDQDNPHKRDQALLLVEHALQSGDGLISTQVVQEFCNLALRKFAVPLSAGECRAYLDEVLLPLCRVFPSEGLFREALVLCEQHQLSWYDSLIVAAARAAGCATLYTEDLQNGMRFGGLVVRNPFG